MMRFVVLMFLFQAADPVPDSVKLQIVTARRDMLQAEKDKRESMIAFHAAESRYEAAKHRLAESQPIADASCAPKRFDADAMACK